MKKAQYTSRSLSVEVLAEAEVVGGVKLAPEPAWVEGTSLRLPKNLHLKEIFYGFRSYENLQADNQGRKHPRWNDFGSSRETRW